MQRRHFTQATLAATALVGITASLVTDRVTVSAAVVAGAASVAAYALPLKLNIVVAMAAAVALGVVWDTMNASKLAVDSTPEPAPRGDRTRS